MSMTDDDAVKLARTVIGDLFGDTIDRSTTQDLARAVLSQHEHYRQLFDAWVTAVERHRPCEAENTKLREALREALDHWEVHMGNSGTMPTSPQYDRIAAIRKEFGLE